MGFKIKDGILKKYTEEYGVTWVVIPDGVTSIGDSAFNNCISLFSITIPNGVTSIGDRAFGACESLTSITIPDSVTSIGDDVFEYCENLTSIIIKTNNNEYKINLTERGNMNIETTLENISHIFKEKDFSVKLDLRIKFKLIMDYFFCTSDEDAKVYIKKNFIKAMKQLIENGDTDRINKILKKTDFVTKRNIDKFITHATDNQQQKIQTVLTDYKNQTFK